MGVSFWRALALMVRSCSSSDCRANNVFDWTDGLPRRRKLMMLGCVFLVPCLVPFLIILTFLAGAGKAMADEANNKPTTREDICEVLIDMIYYIKNEGILFIRDGMSYSKTTWKLTFEIDRNLE